MGRVWFRPMGWLWRPVSVEGWLATAGFAAVGSWWFVAIDRRSHSVSDSLLGAFPYLAPLAILWGFVASKSASRAGRPS